MIITKKAIGRRTILRGLGASLALPLLDGMVPALTAAPGRFAAAIALCSYGFDDMIARAAKIPVWIFQGDADEIVSVERAASGSPRCAMRETRPSTRKFPTGATTYGRKPPQAQPYLRVVRAAIRKI